MLTRLVLNRVNPMYYVGFSTMTLVASLILFQGLNTSDASGTLSLLAGFVTTFLGVHLLNLSRAPEPPGGHHGGALEAGLMNLRLSLQGRASMDGWGGAPPPAVPAANGHARRGSRGGSRGSVIFNAYEDELPPGGQAVGLARLEEGSEEDDEADEMTTLRSPAARVREREERRVRTSPRGSPMGRSTPTLGAQ
jgi:hypothetical protein